MGRLRYLEILGRQITSDRRFHTGALCPRHLTDIGQTDIGARSKRRLQNICSIPSAAPADNFRPNIPGSRRTPGRVDRRTEGVVYCGRYSAGEGGPVSAV